MGSYHLVAHRQENGAPVYAKPGTGAGGEVHYLYRTRSGDWSATDDESDISASNYGGIYTKKSRVDAAHPAEPGLLFQV